MCAAKNQEFITKEGEKLAVTCIWQVKKLRFKEVQQFIQGHPGSM